MLVVCLAGGLVIAAGCGRRDHRPNTPDRRREPQAKPQVVRTKPNPPQTPENAQVELAHPAIEPATSQKKSDTVQPGAENTSGLVAMAPAQALGAQTGGGGSDTSAASRMVTEKQEQLQSTGQKKGGKKQEADALLDNPTLLRIQIQISQAGLNTLRSTHWEGRPKRPVAKAIIREGGLTYSNVAVHLKGAAGSFRSVDDKPAMTLVFDKFVTDQSFHGLHKISLNNSVQDSSFLCEKVARELFIAAGVPVPRAAHALVTLNGRDLGLYVLLEGANKQFLKRYFSNVKGNLYDGGFCQDVNTSLSVNCGDDPDNDDGLKALMAAVRQSMRESKPSYALLEQVLDMDRFLSMVVMEMMLCHWDGYTLNRNNWRIFHDLDSNKMVFIPHGLDQLFGAGRQFDPGSPVKPRNVSGVVTRMILATREGQQRYMERANQIYTHVFKVDKILSRVDEIVTGISPVLAQTHPQIARSLKQRAGSLKQRIIQRGEGLRRQLGVPVNPIEFPRDNVLRLTGWKPSLVQSGEPTLAQVEDSPGKPLLLINAGNAISSSSWRTRLVLASGRYQFEGRIRLRDVEIEEGDERGGAGLRISKGVMPRKLTGTEDWKDYQYAFNISEETTDVELICELRALKGEAWFDVNSLRLVRME